MLNQALSTINLQLFAEDLDDGSAFFEEQLSGESLPDTTPAASVTEGSETAAEPETNKTSLPEQNGQTIRVKYNGEEKDIPLEEAAALAQKGMNYDKVLERLRAAENSEEFKVLDAYAKQNGMSRQQYVKHLQSRQAEALMETEIQELKNKHPEITDALAQELAGIRAKEKQRELAQVERQEQERQKQEQLRPWQDFAKAYPHVKDFASLPEAVRNDVAEGMEPVSAMRKYELSEAKKEIENLKQQLQIKEKNGRNKEKAIGSAASSAAEDPADAFMSGFYSL